MMKQRVLITHQLATDLAKAISECEHDRIFVLTDDTTRMECWPVIESFISMRGAHVISIAPGDIHKNVESLIYVWRELERGRATRHSLLVNLGGGMVTDLGGFAASTFKRGIDFINIPTTLLAMVDSSVGGKTAVAGGAEITGIKDEIRNTANEEIALLRQQNALLQALLQKDYGITTNDIGKAAQTYSREYMRRTGKPAFSI